MVDLTTATRRDRHGSLTVAKTARRRVHVYDEGTRTDAGILSDWGQINVKLNFDLYSGQPLRHGEN